MAAGTYKIGYVPYGYQRDRNGNMIIEPVEAGVVRYIFRTFLAGYGTEAIASALKSRVSPLEKAGNGRVLPSEI